MAYTENPLMTISNLAADDMTDLNRFVKKNDDGLLEYCGLYEKSIGILKLAVNEGKPATIDSYGIILVESGGAISVMNKVTSDALGRAIKAPPGTQLKIKTADEIKKGASVSDDAELVGLELAASIEYKVRAMLSAVNLESSAKNFKSKFVPPSGATITGFHFSGNLLTPALSLDGMNADLTEEKTRNILGTDTALIGLEALLDMGTIAGELDLQWNVGTTETTGMTLKKGSILELQANAEIHVNGVALDAASAAGELIRCMVPLS